MSKQPNNEEIYEVLDRIAPFSTQLPWDNSGFLIGSRTASVQTCVVCLDVTNEALSFAKQTGATLMISHHPIIFSPLKSVAANSVVAQAIADGISVISAHTNLDLADGGVNDALAQKLGLQSVRLFHNEEQLGRIGELPKELSPKEFAETVQHTLVKNGHLSFVEGVKPVKTVAVVGGSGGDLIEAAVLCGADAYVTGEVRHHEWLIAKQYGITVVCAGHAETESVVLDPLREELAKCFPTVSFLSYHESFVSYC